MRESFPRQVDKKSGGPQGERGLEFSRKKKGQTFHGRDWGQEEGEMTEDEMAECHH